MNETLTTQGRVHLGRRRDRGPQETINNAETGRVPRVARLMALAIRFEGLLSADTVRNYSQIAKSDHVTRARVTQIMNLRALAPDIQEALLFLPRTERGRDQIHLAQLQAIAKGWELLSKVVDEDFSGGGFGFDSVDEFETLNYVG